MINVALQAKNPEKYEPDSTDFSNKQYQSFRVSITTKIAEFDAFLFNDSDTVIVSKWRSMPGVGIEEHLDTIVITTSLRATLDEIIISFMDTTRICENLSDELERLSRFRDGTHASIGIERPLIVESTDISNPDDGSLNDRFIYLFLGLKKKRLITKPRYLKQAIELCTDLKNQVQRRSRSNP